MRINGKKRTNSVARNRVVLSDSFAGETIDAVAPRKIDRDAERIEGEVGRRGERRGA